MKIILISLNIIALLSAAYWFLSKPDWEPFITSIGLLTALIAQLYTGNKNDNSGIRMKQKGGNGSTNIQSGRDTKITVQDDKR